MKRAANDPRSPVQPVRPRFHRDLFETMLLDAVNDNKPEVVIPLAPNVEERCYVAADWLESLKGWRLL
jgi:hypothetical protein